ncbi:protein kinase domain-containing protein [Actinomadura rugatobispora]|uniref:PQQ-binding-like beta-propeller repeat protein n=1 Tax=Actinomadura rugatobispora TaxID=1994 RepID=A0ABW1A6H6_9ACTN|nr:hypothetical protein GCM10010200_041960 [Actinomadura rugatobispora]
MEPLGPSDPPRVSTYTLLNRLGSGGMGRVYLARSQGGRLAAVKVIHAHISDDPRFRRRFRREIEAARTVSGHYTAPVIDADPDADPPWLATAFIDAPDLGAVVSAEGPHPPAAVLALAAALAEALEAIHAAGLVHRDLKPSNILCAPDGPRVIDFGIVRAPDHTEITQGLLGTPAYMSPEQADGRPAGPPSDIFSLGGVLYFAATGRPPFGTGPLRPLMARVANAVPDLTDVSPALHTLIGTCLAKDPQARPTATTLLKTLAAEPEPPPTAEPEPPITRHRTRRSRAALAGVIVLAAALVVIVLERRDDPWSVDDVQSSPVVAGGLVYVSHSDGTAAYDARTGRRRWFSPGADQYVTAVRDGMLIAGGARSMSGLQATTGTRRWHVPTAERYCGHLIPGGPIVLKEPSASDLKVSVLNPSTGARTWTKVLPKANCAAQAGANDTTRVNVPDETGMVSYALASGKSWRFTEETQNATSDATNVYILTEKNRLHARDAETGRPRWEAALPSTSTTDPHPSLTVTGSTVYALAEDGVHAFDTASGKRRWRLPLPWVSGGFMHRDGTTAYVVQRGAYTVSAVDLNTGRRLWHRQWEIDTEVIAAGETLYLTSEDDRFLRRDVHRLTAVDPRTGKERWRDDMEVKGLATTGTAAYAVDQKGTLKALDANTGRPLTD